MNAQFFFAVAIVTIWALSIAVIVWQTVAGLEGNHKVDRREDPNLGIQRNYFLCSFGGKHLHILFMLAILSKKN